MIGSTTEGIPARWDLMQSVARAVAGLHTPTSRVAGVADYTGPRP
jgi:hypothetical protein